MCFNQVLDLLIPTSLLSFWHLSLYRQLFYGSLISLNISTVLLTVGLVCNQTILNTVLTFELHIFLRILLLGLSRHPRC